MQHRGAEGAQGKAGERWEGGRNSPWTFFLKDLNAWCLNRALGGESSGVQSPRDLAPVDSGMLFWKAREAQPLFSAHRNSPGFSVRLASAYANL